MLFRSKSDESGVNLARIFIPYGENSKTQGPRTSFNRVAHFAIVLNFFRTKKSHCSLFLSLLSTLSPVDIFLMRPYDISTGHFLRRLYFAKIIKDQHDHYYLLVLTFVSIKNFIGKTRE